MPMPIPGRAPILERRQNAWKTNAITALEDLPEEPEMILTFLYALGVAAVLGLPADYTWRRARQLAPLAGLASAAAIIASIYLAAHIGLLHGTGAVLALIFGLIAGGVAADALASRRWGPASNQY
jgi:hypothetical protein